MCVDWWVLESVVKGEARMSRFTQKKRFILRMWAKGYKGMPRQGWVYMGEEWKRGMRKEKHTGNS